MSLFRCTAFAAITALAVLLSTGCSRAGELDADVVKKFQDANRDLMAGRIDAAIEKLLEVDEKLPTEPFPPYVLAKAYAMKKDSEKAVQWFLTAVDRGVLGSYDLMLEIDTSPELATLRNAPEYQKTINERIPFGDAPDFEAVDFEGNPVKLSDLKGKPVLLVFWTVTCGVCHMEFKALQDEYKALQEKGLVIVAVAPDSVKEQLEHIKDGGWKFNFWRHDPAKRMLPLLYAVTSKATPANFFIDREGRIVRFYQGYVRSGDFGYPIDLITKKE